MSLKKFTYYLNELRCWLYRRIAFDIQPHTDVALNDALFKVTGDEPALLLSPLRGSMPQGWYMLSINVEADIPVLNIRLFADYGSGFHESESLLLIAHNGNLTKRLCYFPEMPERLRLDPADMPCTFTIKHLSLNKVTQGFAIDRMAKKVHGRKKDVHVEQAGKDQASLKILWQKYDNVFLHHPASPSVPRYREWISGNETPEKFVHKLEEDSYQPLISIVVPVWNTPAELLQRCIESVREQSYRRWQLCLADDASTLPHVKAILAGYAAADSRIECVYRAENGHICKASNSAMELAGGEFIALLDHDDELSPHALMEVVRALQENRQARILYSDEDKIDEAGNRFEPHFKPDWNRDLLYSQNYISHLGVYQTALVREVGGFRPGLEGSQDYDLLLRCVAGIADQEIVHIPKVLYHWRAVAGSTALDPGSKSYTERAGLRALRDHFKELGQDVEVQSGALPNTYKVRWPIPSTPPLVSLLIPTRNNHQLLRQCIDSILTKTTYEHYQILVLDNQTSHRASLAYLRQLAGHEKIRVVQYDHPFNYSAINNFGVTLAAGEIIGLINDDVEVIAENWLTEMVSHALRPDVGCVGAKLYYRNDTIQHAGVVLGIGGVANHSHAKFDRHHPGYFGRLKVTQNVSAVTGACLLVRKTVYQEVGGLNEVDLKIAFNDIDFCLRVRRAGYRNLWSPYAELYHHESASRGKEDTPEKMARFVKENTYMLETWADEIDNDPCYNPNLTRSREDFSLS